MALFTDVSEDPERILSIVVGCVDCDVRAVYTSRSEVEQWKIQHMHDIHPGENRDSLEPPKPTAERTERDTILELLDGKEMPTTSIAEATGKRYGTAYQLLDRMHASGLLDKRRINGPMHWSVRKQHG